MKDEFTNGALYYTQHPLSPTKFVIAKASTDGHKKMLSFFICDVNGQIKWDDAKLAYRVAIKKYCPDK